MYTIEHLSGEQNITTDMTKLWYKGYCGKRGQVRHETEASETLDILPSPANPDFERPTDKLIKDPQKQLQRSLPVNAHLDPSGIFKLDGKIWVPDADSALQI